MSYSWDAILQSVAHTLGDVSGLEIAVDELVAPPDSKLGDLAFGCFRVAKMQGKNPALIAKEIAEKIGKSNQNIESATAAGPYVNIMLSADQVNGRIVRDIEKRRASFGEIDLGKGQELMVEYAQPNTHKEIHVGHLRNLLIGSSLVRILKNAQWNTITASYHGDVGAHVAKCLWHVVKTYAFAVPQPRVKHKKNQPSPQPRDEGAWSTFLLEHLSEEHVDVLLGAIPEAERSGRFLGRMYTEASRLLAENEGEGDELKKAEASYVQRCIEAREPAWIKLWLETRRWSMTEMRDMFETFSINIDRQYWESEVDEAGQKIVDELLAKGIATKSQGAIVVDLESKKLGIFLIRKSDGASLYATKDLALAKLKDHEYPNLARSFVVVDNRQSLYFKQLFTTLELMGVTHPTEFIGYEFVTLKSGAMSSREGNIVTLQAFVEEVVAYARAETSKRHPDWTDGRIEHTAWALAMGGMKFGMLKQNSDKIITFDLEQALSFDGDTGPYVQYAVTRLGSILRKAGYKPDVNQHSHEVIGLTGSAEKRLALCAAELPRVAERAARELRPALIAQWCIDMAAKTNEFYRDVHVLENADLRPARLRLVAAARLALLRGLDLLGIPVPEEM